MTGSEQLLDILSKQAAILYEGGCSSRVYDGEWCVRTTYIREDGTFEHDYSEPDSYEGCERRLLLHGLGIGFDTAGYGMEPNPRRVFSARLVTAQEAALD